MDIKSIDGKFLIGKKIRIGRSFTSAAKDVVGGSNGYSGELAIDNSNILL